MWELRFWSCSAETLRCVLASILAIVLASAAAAQAPQIALEPILSNLTEPVFLTHSRDGTHRPDYQPGMELHGRYTFFAEGARGHLL